MVWGFILAGCDGGEPSLEWDFETNDLEVDFGAIDFGAVDAGCEATQTVRVTNPNPYTVRLQDFTLTGDDRDFVVRGLDDAAISRGEEHTFTVVYDGSAGVTSTSELTMRWSASVGPVAQDDQLQVDFPLSIALTATGVDEPRWAQSFVQPEPRKGDFLFVFDDPEEMESRIDLYVAPGVGQLFTALDERGGDYQVAALIDEGTGRFQGPIVGPNTADAGAVLGAQLQDTSFSQFGTADGLFNAVEDALSPSQLGAPPNQGFNRLDSVLSVIFLADRDTYWQDQHSDVFQTFLRNQRPDATDIRVHVLGPDQACSTYDWNAAELESLAAATYGRHLPICDADSTFFHDVAVSGLGMDGGYELDAQPTGTTCDEVTVEVGGAFVPCTAWTLQDQRLFMRAPYIPAPGASIAIDYRVDEACELYQEPMSRP